MKPRRTSLKSLRFDPQGAFIGDQGINPSEVRALAPRLGAIRDAMMGDELKMLAGEWETPPAYQPLDAGFIQLPEKLLQEYEADRRQSLLGRLFRLANRLQEQIDRVVVLGIGGSYMGAKALMDACCQPYWNELSRGERGSKPRMYFEGNNADNDATQGLLQLLSAKRIGIGDDDRRPWALVAISKTGETVETAVAFRQFLKAIEDSCSGSQALIKSLIVPVTGGGGLLRQIAEEIGCEDLFPVPEDVGGRFSVLSAAGLVPAAILGLNVIELLAGAAEMNRHFRETPPEHNIVLQFVAVNHLLETKQGLNIRILSVWSKSLESLGLWYDQLSAESLGKSGLGSTPLTCVNTRDLHSRHQQHQQGAFNKIINNVIVDAYRFDALAVGRRDVDADSLNELGEKTLPDIMSAAIQGTNEALHHDGRPTTDLHLPRTDELHMGQLLQMLMLATVVEGRLMGINPYGQPGVEMYKNNMNRLLGRKVIDEATNTEGTMQ